ncbi:centrosomal protein of 152 kDa-like isoform X2 [Ischnura elegans]|uniref:centrosomal protein of 152 kDa-like isoform X2 n=1 Tax=Ischnura elegans TaxID=197161 RepID=UPI001ED88E7F|nr:centrosomal protein of 152 kDa-like isoform X2 [Ischnura elegans]
MEGPGISLFQGSESLEIANNQEEEENEALEDERRRNDELRDLISNAFDDLTDDDQSYADSSRPLSSNDTANQDNESRRESPHRHDFNSIGEEANLGNRRTNPAEERNHPRRTIAATGYNGPGDPHFPAKGSPFIGAGDSNVSALHYKHCTRVSPGFSEAPAGTYNYSQDHINKNIPDDEQYLKTEYNSLEQLQVLYEVRIKEIQRLHDEIEKSRNESKQMELQLKRRLTLMEAEKERAALSLKQSQNLLVTSKAQIEELQKQTEEQKKTITSLEESNYNLTTQLEIAKSSVNDLQNRISFLEKIDTSKKKELENESYLKLIEERHRKEMNCMQEEVEVMKVKYNKKESECASLEKKVTEVTKSLEATLADKTEVINRLARSLEESQARCEQLMSSQAGQENCELRMQLAGERSEKEMLQEKITSLQKTVDMLQADLRNYEAASRLGFLGSENTKESDSIVHLGIPGGSLSGMGGVDSKNDVNIKLKEELKRSLIGQRIKREEIRRLQMELEARDLQIQELQLQESKFIAEAEKIKVESQKLIKQCRRASSNADPNSRTALLEKELAILQEQIKKLKDKSETLDYENKRLEKDYSSLTVENANLYKKIEEISQAKEKEKQEVIDKFQNEYIKFHDQSLARVRAEKNEAMEKEIKELRRQLEEAHKIDEAKRAFLESDGEKHLSAGMKGDGNDLIGDLQKQLQQEKEEFAKFRENYKILVKQKCEALQKENSQLVQEMEKRSRTLYEKKVGEEIDKAKEECIKELEQHYEAQMEKLMKEMEKGMLEKQKKMVDAEVAKIKSQMVSSLGKDADEKVSELFKECCRLREELNAKEQHWNQEIEKAKMEAEKEKLDKLRENQKEIEERLGQEFREQLKHAEETREHAAKILKEQLAAEQAAFLQRYEDKLHDYSLKVKPASSRSIATSPPECVTPDVNTVTKEDVEKLLKEKEMAMEEKLSKEIEEAERRARLEAESLYSGNLGVFQKLMEAKTAEVEEIRAAMATERNRFKAALIEARAAAASAAELKFKEVGTELIQLKEGEINSLRQQIIQLTKELEVITNRATEEKGAMAETMARWASEVQEMKAARKNENKKLLQIYKKYQEIKKTVGEYKVYLENKDKHLKNEHKQLVENFTSVLGVIEERMKEVCSHQDAVKAEKLALIEAAYEKKAEKLLQKLTLLKQEQPS